MQRDTVSVGQWPGPGIAGCTADLGVFGVHYPLECNLNKFNTKINTRVHVHVDLSVAVPQSGKNFIFVRIV